MPNGRQLTKSVRSHTVRDLGDFWAIQRSAPRTSAWLLERDGFGLPSPVAVTPAILSTSCRLLLGRRLANNYQTKMQHNINAWLTLLPRTSPRRWGKLLHRAKSEDLTIETRCSAAEWTGLRSSNPLRLQQPGRIVAPRRALTLPIGLARSLSVAIESISARKTRSGRYAMR